MPLLVLGTVYTKSFHSNVEIYRLREFTMNFSLNSKTGACNRKFEMVLVFLFGSIVSGISKGFFIVILCNF